MNDEERSFETTEIRLDVQRAYDRIKQILSNKSDVSVEQSIKLGKAQPSREIDKKQVIDRLLKMFEKKLEMAGVTDTFDRTEDEEDLLDSKMKVSNLVVRGIGIGWK